MSDLKIGNVEITFDVEAVTVTEHRKFAKGSMLEDQDDGFLAKVTGQPVEWIRGLTWQFYRRLVAGYFAKANSPLSDPN